MGEQPLVELCFTERFRASLLGNTLSSQVVDAVSLCLLKPQFPYIPFFRSLCCSELRRPTEFLPPTIFTRLAADNDHLPDFLWASPPKSTLSSELHQLTDQRLEGILVAHFCLHDIMDYSQEAPVVSCTWDETLYNILIEVKECFPNACFRTICLMGSGMHSAVKNSDNIGTQVNRFTLKLLLELEVDIYWSREDDCDGISWMKRFIAAIDKCRVRVPPSAFRARTSHPALSKMPSGKEKNWLHQLIQIPGIEYESAQAIAQRFPTAKDLIVFLEETKDEDAAQKELANIQVTRCSGTRKLNNALASRLRQLFGPDAQPTAWVIKDVQ